MSEVTLLRSNQWITKSQLPKVFKAVYDHTFTPLLILKAFKTCGISPVNRKIHTNLIPSCSKKVEQQKLPVPESPKDCHSNKLDISNNMDSSIKDECLVEELFDIPINMEVNAHESVLNETHIPVLMTADTNEPQTCPP